jgi:phosphohistidine phosphatase
VNLYLLRHGEAQAKQQDPERPLTAAGAEMARRVARFLGGLDLRLAGVQHSTKLRARQTAEIIAEGAGLSAPVTQVPNLEPLDDVEGLADALTSGATSDLMLVGHLPHLNRLASRLVAGDAGLELFAFPECGVLCLRRGEGNAGAGPVWRVQWMIAPESLL